ncbi:MAG: adenosylmethionine decarboxylase [Fimbriimonadaceae bacterium]|nr:adenosylmethionine decarboxylase [Fimbriimonadaceae bacterium]
MSQVLLLVSLSVVFAALTLRQGDSAQPWWVRLLERLRPRAAVAEPVVSHESGWTLIHCDDAESFNAWLGRDEEGLPTKPGEEPSLGSHLLVELFGCESKLLEEERTVGDAMREAAVQSEATIVAQSFHEFKPWGVSGAVIIQESHYTIHTWPEHEYAAVDLFYCGGTVLVHKAVEVLERRFRPKRIKFLVVRRGLQSEVHK